MITWIVLGDAATRAARSSPCELGQTQPLPLGARVRPPQPARTYPSTGPIPTPYAVPLPRGVHPESAWAPLVVAAGFIAALMVLLGVLAWWLG